MAEEYLFESWQGRESCIFSKASRLALVRTPSPVQSVSVSLPWNWASKIRRRTRNRLCMILWVPTRYQWGLCSFGILRSVVWQQFTDVSWQPIGPIFKGQTIQEICLVCWTFEGGAIDSSETWVTNSTQKCENLNIRVYCNSTQKTKNT